MGFVFREWDVCAERQFRAMNRKYVVPIMVDAERAGRRPTDRLRSQPGRERT